MKINLSCHDKFCEIRLKNIENNNDNSINYMRNNKLNLKVKRTLHHIDRTNIYLIFAHVCFS